MLIAMVEAEKATNAPGQKIAVFTADQRLYSVVLDIMWGDQKHWMFFVPRLGQMHWLTSFIIIVGAYVWQWLEGDSK